MGLIGSLQTDLSSKQCTLDPWLYGAFHSGLTVALIWYQICQDPMWLRFSSKILTKSKSWQTLQSSLVRWETWRLALLRDSYSQGWDTLHTWSRHTGGSATHVWGHIWDIWDFSPQLITARRGGGRLWRKAPGLCPLCDQSAQDPISWPYGAHTKVLVMSQPDLRDSQKSFLIATILDALSTFVGGTSNWSQQ